MKTLLNCFLILSTGALFFSCSNQAGFSLASTSEDFKQNYTYNNKVDIVLIVDNSLSMTKYQNNLIQQIPAFTQRLNSLKLDYHFAVISTSVNEVDNGAKFIGNPAFLTGLTVNVESEMQSRIQLGDHGSDFEAPLLNFKNIFKWEQSNSYINTLGAGFLRQDALLGIIVLSDDNDGSTVTSGEFAQLLDRMKPPFNTGDRGWIYNYIGVLNLQSPCKNDVTGNVTPGIKHLDLVNMSGGVKASICDQTLEYAVSNIRARLVERITDYPLKKEPKIETIQVIVNGQPVPQDNNNGWSYLPGPPPAIRFHGTAVPAADASIVVLFDPSSAN